MTQLDPPGGSPRPRGRDQIDAIQIVTRPKERLRITWPWPAPLRALPGTNSRANGEERYCVERFGNPTSRHQPPCSRLLGADLPMRGLNVADAETSNVYRPTSPPLLVLMMMS
jgi:hypothetical protein